MEPFLYYSLFTIIVAFIIIITLTKANTSLSNKKNLPPCPPTLPIIGNLHHLKPRLHRTLYALSQTYGHIFSLWFGSRLVVVVSCPTLAQQCLTKYDTVLANRPRFLTGKYLFYNHTSLVFSSNNDHWRNLRRIATMDVLSMPRLNSFFETRRDEVTRFIRNLVADTSMGFARVQLRPRITEKSLNNMMRMHDDCSDRDDNRAGRFREIIREILSLVDANNKSDFLPLLRWFDFDGFVKRLKRVGEEADVFWQGLLEEHRNGEHGNNDTMIQHLLLLQKLQPNYYTDHIIKGLIQDMLLAGTNTTVLTMEWTLSALLNHPEILRKAKEEIDNHIGKDRLVDESDIPNLPYLQNIIHETLRLYSPSPLLLPHFSSDEVNIGGFTIPRDTIVLINSWAMRRDPKLWGDDVECFKPERFEKEGEANKLMAFGLGRRACPGSGLANRIMGLTLGLLVQCFEWERLNREEIDMREDKGFTFAKLVPLEAMCKARPISKKLVKHEI
ncbi:hypothetical protein AAHE18_13G369800 [Arachis hypogaea]|uniref:Cytochrome P450 n=1 Tax=Arachis hypogaea TaxID=3818 RepID=A0A444ZSS4_ARAHY|nr:hypothetical protein Ahy_B03g062006 [Arachis hypogaea]